ncbi:MAG: hypothetical protein NZ949_00260 [Candidatus Kapabacteria bacterium]|nr:hypothetical protein [Candidatus Kapabacteria bacterium]MDW7997035.1 hypothetical protein [Bacteroidota bacterium]
MLAEHVVGAVLVRKIRRRLCEYVIVLALQGFFVGVFTPVVELALALPIGVLSLGLGITLAWLREQRRLLVDSYQRLAIDSTEIFLLLALLGISGLVAYGLRLPLIAYQAHLSYALFGYILGSLAGEVGWRWLVFAQLSGELQYRYVRNLAPSLIFSYSWHHLKRLWQR